MSKKRNLQPKNKQSTEVVVKEETMETKVKEQGTNPSVTIDGATYTLESLGEQGREQLRNLQVTDQEIRRLQDQLAIMQTARNTYARILAGVTKDVAPQA